MLQFHFLSVAVVVATVSTLEADRFVLIPAHAGPSLLQIGTSTRQVTHDPFLRDAPRIVVSKHFAPADALPQQASSVRLGSQFLLEAGTIVALLLLSGAALYLCVEHKFFGSDLANRWHGAQSSLPQAPLRVAAWGEYVQNDPCDYVMVFADWNRSEANQVGRQLSRALSSLSSRSISSRLRMVPAFEFAKAAFLDPHRHHFASEENLRERFPEEMTFEEYRDAACDFLLAMLTSSCFGFSVDQFQSPDYRSFWRLELGEEGLAQYAAHYRYQLPLNDAAYRKAGVPVPTNWNGDKVYAFWPYMPKWSKMYSEFEKVDRLKLMRMRIERYINLDALQQQHVLLQFFAVHDLEDIELLCRKWGNLAKWYRFPSWQSIDMIKDYFGEQIGFMFLWQRYYCGALVVPAIFGGAVFFRRFCLPEKAHSAIQLVFTIFMLAWATMFNATYVRFEARIRQRWGMTALETGATDVNAAYNPSGHTGWRMWLLFFTGDVAALAMMVLTVVGMFGIQRLRSLHQNLPYWYNMGVKQGSAVLISILILILDSAWQFASYYIVNHENHRLRSDWWNSWIKRMLPVRVFIYIYPFVFIGFLKEFTSEGCPNSARGCLDELQTSLFTFFALSVLCNLLRDIVLIAYARIQHKMELQGRTSDGNNAATSQHKFLQVQATLYDYNDWIFIDDWTRQVTTFLLLICFNVVLPVIGVFVLLTTMFEARLLAHRICCHLQRPCPSGTQGIGAWQSVLEAMTFLGVLLTVCFAIFVMHPLRERPLWEKFVIFVASEHALLLLNLFLRMKFPSTPPDVHEVTAWNDKMLLHNFMDPNLHGIHIEKTDSVAHASRFMRAVHRAVEQNRAMGRSVADDADPEPTPEREPQ